MIDFLNLRDLLAIIFVAISYKPKIVCNQINVTNVS